MVGDPARTGDVKGILGKNSRYNKMVNEAMRDEKEFWGTQLNDVLASTVAVKTYGKAMSCMENVLEAQIQGGTAPDEAYEKIQVAIQQLPTWVVKMRSGATAKIEGLVISSIKALLRESSIPTGTGDEHDCAFCRHLSTLIADAIKVWSNKKLKFVFPDKLDDLKGFQLSANKKISVLDIRTRKAAVLVAINNFNKDSLNQDKVASLEFAVGNARGLTFANEETDFRNEYETAIATTFEFADLTKQPLPEVVTNEICTRAMTVVADLQTMSDQSLTWQNSDQTTCYLKMFDVMQVVTEAHMALVAYEALSAEDTGRAAADKSDDKYKALAENYHKCLLKISELDDLGPRAEAWTETYSAFQAKVLELADVMLQRLMAHREQRVGLAIEDLKTKRDALRDIEQLDWKKELAADAGWAVVSKHADKTLFSAKGLGKRLQAAHEEAIQVSRVMLDYAYPRCFAKSGQGHAHRAKPNFIGCFCLRAFVCLL